MNTPHMMSDRSQRSFATPLRRTLLCVGLLTFTSGLISTSAFAQITRAVDTGALQPGSIEGVLVVGNKPIAGTSVMIRETGQSSVTDKYGIYRFTAVAPGTYTLVATADGYQKLHITDVVVKPNGSMTLSQVQMHKPVDGVVALEPYVVKGEANNTIELDKYLVEGSKAKPFADGNVDIPRTVNDAQPYYIFDSKTIDQSGAINVQDFLKKRLTMNTVARSNSQNVGASSNSLSSASVLGNTSSIDLRGLGTDKTLILINGRRAPNVAFDSTLSQPDLNGIPLSAIDRIEVLPASASGIYGGSALGGVVNVILKRSYQGGEIRLNYENTWDTDAPIRSASFSYGQKFDATKTQLLISAQWSDSKSLLLQDRREMYERGLSIAVKNSPSFVYGIFVLGSSPNVSSLGGPLVLKDGTPLNSLVTYIPAGTTASTPSATLRAGLLANAGTQNLVPPPTWQNPTGLYRQLTSTPENKSLRASIRQELWPTVEASLDWSHNENASATRINFFQSFFVLGANVPTNPFSNLVLLNIPISASVINESDVTLDTLSAGFTVDLPRKWTGQFDYSWSRSSTNYNLPGYDSTAISNDINTGVFNVFIDTLLTPPNFEKYRTFGTRLYRESLLSDFAARASGPVEILPWGSLDLTLGLEHRVAETPENVTDQAGSGGVINRTLYFARRQVTDSGYAEALIPLVKKDWIPFVHSLELQLAGRSERYEVDTGTPNSITNLTTGVVTYATPNLSGQPFFDRTSYASNNATFGLKYQPLREVTFRASIATAFVPPQPVQLVKNPIVNPSLSNVTDPKNNNAIVAVQTIGGGNPDLQPQNSRSFNAGIIWIPESKALKGLRVNLEYNKIKQFDFITSLGTQILVDNENVFGRVTRDSAGRITLVDISLLNLFKLENESWDLSANYVVKTAVGTFSIDALQSLVTHAKVQYSLTLPEYDAAGFPSEGGPVKYKSNGTVRWERGNWLVGWSSTYFGSYKQFGAAGGPTAQRSGAPSTSRTAPQGSDSIPSQLYHDLLVGYSFRGRDTNRVAIGDRFLSNLSIQVGLKNVFNHEPPYDVSYDLYISPFGDTRLRSYWVSLKKEF